jgi:hypothetical protein
MCSFQGEYFTQYYPCLQGPPSWLTQPGVRSDMKLGTPSEVLGRGIPVTPDPSPPGVGCWRYDRPIVYRLLAMNRIRRRLFRAFATAAVIGGLIGSPAALADDDPPPPPPAPEAAPADVPEIPMEHCLYISILQPCLEVPSPLPPDNPGTPDEP